MPAQSMKIFAAEVIGTTILMLGGPGSAILAGDKIGNYGVAFAFGLSLMVAAYVVGPVSGCHINPAVTLGLAAMRKIEMVLVPVYVVAQLIGAAIGGGIIFAIANGQAGFSASASGFATNGWADRSPSVPGFNFGAMVVVEIVFTAVLVFMVIGTTSKKFTTAQGGLVVGFTLTLIHLVSIPVDNTSVNPARSFGTALWSGSSGAWEQLWAFIVFPLVGAVVGVLVWLAMDDSRLEDTMFANTATVRARDTLAGATARITESGDTEGTMIPDGGAPPTDTPAGSGTSD